MTENLTSVRQEDLKNMAEQSLSRPELGVSSSIPRLEEFNEDHQSETQTSITQDQDTHRPDYTGSDIETEADDRDRLQDVLPEDDLSEISELTGLQKVKESTVAGDEGTGFPDREDPMEGATTASCSGYPSTENRTAPDESVTSPRLREKPTRRHLTKICMQANRALTPHWFDYDEPILTKLGLKSVRPDGTTFSMSCVDCFDLRNKTEGVYKSVKIVLRCSQNETIESAAASHFQCGQELVRQLTVKTFGMMSKVLVVGVSEKHFILLVRFGDLHCLTCVVLKPDSTFHDCFLLCHQWLEEHAHGSHQTDVSYCLLSDSKKFDVESADLLVSENLQQFEPISMVKVETQMVQVVHRSTPKTHQVFYTDCQNTDSIMELKQKFLQVYKDETGQTVNESDLQLTAGTKLLSDNQFLRNILHVPSLDDFYDLDSSDTEASDVMNTKRFYAHFQPEDAVVASLHFKSEERKHQKSLVVISPTATVEALRHEIAKVTHKYPFSFKVLVNGKKLEMDANLGQVLAVPNCKIVVEPQKKVMISVEAREVNSVSGSHQRFSVSLHKHESVNRLKSEVCGHLQIAPYCVDLVHENAQLQDQETLRTSNLRQGRTVHALVLRNRVRVRVRLSSGRWEDIVVDDLTISTVSHLKAFASFHLKTQSGTVHFTAILNGQALSDPDTLKEAGVKMNDRILLIQTDRLCYTAVFGCVPVILCTNEGVSKREMAMSNGKKFFFDAQVFNSLHGQEQTDEVDIKPNSQPPHQGLYLCPPELRKRFPSSPTKTASPSEEGSCSHALHCCVCRSHSALVVQQTNRGAGVSEAHGGDVLDSDTFQEGIAQESASTPVFAPSKRQKSSSSQAVAARYSTDYGPLQHPFQSLQDSASGKVLTSARGVSDSQPPSCTTSNQNTRNTTSLTEEEDDSLFSVSNPSLSSSSQPQSSLQSSTSGHASVLTDAKQEADKNGLQDTGSRKVDGVTEGLNVSGETGRPSPNLQLSLLSNLSSTHEGDTRKSEMLGTRETYSKENISKAADGSLVTSKTTQTVVRCSANFCKSFGQGSPFSFFGSDSATPAITFPSTGDLGGEQPSCHASTFKYIDVKVLLHVAKHLGREYGRVIVQLGVPHQVMQEAEEKYHGDWFRISHDCLIKWCQMSGKHANIETLKQVLKDNERFDLADDIGQMDGYQTC